MNKKHFILSLLVAFCAIGNAFADTFVMYANNVTGKQGETVNIVVSLANTEEGRDFQMNIALPEGCTIPTDSYGDYMIANGERNGKHQVSCNFSDGVYKLAVASMSGTAIRPGSGSVLIVPVVLNANPGNYTVNFTNCYISQVDADNNATDIPLTDFSSTITIEETGGIAYEENQFYGNDIEINAGENASLAIYLNAMFEFLGYSVDVTLPGAVTFGNITYGECVSVSNFTNNSTWNAPVLKLTGEAGSGRRDPLGSDGNNVLATVELQTATLAPGEYSIVLGSQSLMNEDEEEYNANDYVITLTIKGAAPTSFSLIDGQSYSNSETYNGINVSYTRNFETDAWQSLYVPFDMSYDDWKDKAEVAYINNVHQYDDDENGTIDRTVLEFIRKKSGSIMANTPYVIKPKQTGEVTLTAESTTLYAAPETDGYVDCMSTTTKYTLYGTYQEKTDMYANGYYAMSGGNFMQAESSSVVLSPFRTYLKIENRNGGNGFNAPKKVRVVVDGVMDDEATAVEGLAIEQLTVDHCVYNLAGQKVDCDYKGIVINNGRKVLRK